MRRDPLTPVSDYEDPDVLCAVSIALRVCGPEAAQNLVRDFGGTRIFIPKAASAQHPLSISIGQANANALCGECYGVNVYIPMGNPDRWSRRRALVQHLVAEGMTMPAIARRLGYSERTVARDLFILRNSGVEINTKRNHTRKIENDDHQ